jgi:hypothetical protein
LRELSLSAGSTLALLRVEPLEVVLQSQVSVPDKKVHKYRHLTKNSVMHERHDLHVMNEMQTRFFY